MFSRRFDLDVPDVSVERARGLAVPFGRKSGGRALWLRIVEAEGSTRITARYATGSVSGYGGSYTPNGTVRGRIEPDEATGGIRIVGRMRWGMIGYIVGVMVICGLVVAGMAIGYRNGVIGWFALVPFGVAVVNLVVLGPMMRDDPEVLTAELRRVFSGDQERRDAELDAAFLERHGLTLAEFRAAPIAGHNRPRRRWRR